MTQYIADTQVKQGNIELSGVPFEEDQDVRVIVIPRANLQKMAYREVQELTKSLSGDLADDVQAERETE